MRKLLIFLLLTSPVFAGFTKCYPVVFNNHPSSTLTDFPATFCANGPNGGFCDATAHSGLALTSLKATGSGGDVTSSSGYDIGWFSNAGCSSSIPFYLIPGVYEPTTGLIQFRVKISSLASGSDTTVYLGVGNAAITTDQSSTATFFSNVMGYYPFPNASSLNTNDLTANAFNASINGGVTAGAGQVDGGAVFNGSTGWLSTSLSNSPLGSLTTLAWINISSAASNPMINRQNNSSGGYFLVNTSRQLQCCSSDICTTAVSNELVPLNTWTHVGCQWGNLLELGVSHIYINGVEATYFAAGSNTATTFTNMAIGGNFGASLLFPGTMDELMVFNANNTTIPLAWVAAEYNNTSAPWNYYTIGAPVSASVVRHRAISQ